MTNALKHGGPDARALVELDCRGSELVVRVTDDGRGGGGAARLRRPRAGGDAGAGRHVRRGGLGGAAAGWRLRGAGQAAGAAGQGGLGRSGWTR
ncbi:hypothetical protein ACFSTC_46150 [Nonomuraea ferruginea]